MRILLIDDDIKFLQVFKKYVNDFCEKLFNDYEIIELTSLDSTLIGDLIFLDIDLNGINSINEVKRLKMYNKNAIIIFVTSRENLVFNAFKAQPFYFIRKNQLNQDIGIAFSLLRKHYHDKVSYSFFENGRKKVVYLDDILYLECNDHIITMYTINSSYDFYRSLKEMIMQLNINDYTNIIQIHKKYCVNFLHIEDVKGDQIKLLNGQIFKIGRKYKGNFFEEYNKFMKGYIVDV